MQTNIKKGIAGVAIGATLLGGVDASVLNETPIERVEIVANERLETKQIGNKVETAFPWKGEEGIKVVADLGTPTITELITDKRKREVITEIVDFGEGGFKIDILLNKKPDTNRFCYQIKGAENYDFFYQPALTQEEIEQGAERPENIVGSYAVYHKELKNHELGKDNYATGKVMHIPRPQVWELNDESMKEWAELSYREGQLCVTARQEFLNKAKYPVRIDPTFGYTSVGASSGTVAVTDFVNGTTVGKYTFGSSESITSLSIYGQVTGGSGTQLNYNGVIYENTGSLPVARLAYKTAALSTTLQWWNFTFDSPYSAAANDYWLGLNKEAIGFAFTYKYDSGGTSRARNDGGGSGTPPSNPFGTDATSGTNKISVYATYTASGGGAAPTQGVLWFE